VFICVNGAFFCIVFHFHILVISLILSNKLEMINLRSKEINLIIKDIQNNIGFVVTSCSSGISTTVYGSMMLDITILWIKFNELEMYEKQCCKKIWG